MRYFVDVGPLVDEIRELVTAYVSGIVASVSDIRHYITPIVEGIVLDDRDTHQDAVRMLSESNIPTTPADQCITRHMEYLTETLHDVIRQYRACPCTVYVVLVSERTALIDIEKCPPLVFSVDNDDYRVRLQQAIDNGDYLPERLRRLL